MAAGRRAPAIDAGGVERYDGVRTGTGHVDTSLTGRSGPPRAEQGAVALHDHLFDFLERERQGGWRLRMEPIDTKSEQAQEQKGKSEFHGDAQ